MKAKAIAQVSSTHTKLQLIVWGIGLGIPIFQLVSGGFVPLPGPFLIALYGSPILYLFRYALLVSLGDQHSRDYWLVPAMVLFFALTLPVIIKVSKIGEPVTDGILLLR